MSSELSPKANKERAASILIPLLLLNFVLLSLQISGPSGAPLFKTWALAIQDPVITVVSGAFNGIRHVWTSYIWMAGARAENRRLHEEVQRLSLLTSSYEQIRQENTRLLRLLSIKDQVEHRTIGARVTARVPNFLANLMYIDRGTADGVHPDAPVLSGDGIVGRVILASRRQSQVQLISNANAAIGAMLEKTRTPGVLRGTGDILLEMHYISNIEEVLVDDVVMSSGLDGIFPKGLVIGKVVESGRGPGVFRTIRVRPFIDLVNIEEVLVLLKDKNPDQER
ncbi:MAG TPA: rod shape-determining protein MreC [Acidobacteriota bacterium]|nr:rod shape-determining protein MreC [Acidobacteriota bacterium]